MRARIAALAVGLVFGAILCWSRTLLGDGPVGWSRELPRRRHVVGSICAGVVLGVALYHRSGAAESEPAADLPMNGLSQDQIAGRNDRALVEAGSQ